MPRQHWWPVRGLSAILMLGVSLAVAAQDTDRPRKKGKQADPPRTTLYMSQLRGLFARWDTNKDDALDKKELAVAFRGPRAKPYDARETKDKEKADEKKADDKSESEKDKTPPEKDKPAKTPDYSNYPDYQFLTQLDKDRDGQISRDEFMEWAREYAMQLRDQKELNDKATKLQQKLNKTRPNAKNRKSLEGELNKLEQQVKNLQRQMRRYQNIQKALR